MVTGTPSVIILFNEEQAIVNQPLMDSKALKSVPWTIPEDEFSNELLKL